MKNKKRELNAKSKLFDEWADDIVCHDDISALIANMFDNGWSFDLVKKYCLSHFKFEEGEFEEKCLDYKKDSASKHPELVKLDNYIPKLKKAKPKEDYSIELDYLNKIIDGTKRTSINDFDRLSGCLINTNWEDEPIIIKNIINTPAPENIRVRYTIPYSNDYDFSLNVQIEILNKGSYDMASFYCRLTPEVVQELKDHDLIHTIAGLRESDIDKDIKNLTNRINESNKILNNLQAIKNKL